MLPLEIKVDVEPKAKARARTVFFHGHARTYTPRTTVEAERELVSYLLPYKNMAVEPHKPIKVTLGFYRSLPTYMNKHDILPYRRPDADNLAKWALDAMTPVLIPDDAQITFLAAFKRWSTIGHGYVTIRIEDDNA
jgi:Holliday junction resolvase RusA-like endonuclease